MSNINILNLKGKEEFITILTTICRYKKINKSQTTSKDQFYFRLIKKPIDRYEIAIEKIAEYDFIVRVFLKTKIESWIHIDGILEERNDLRKKRVTDHPVFQINCLYDIVLNNTHKSLEELPKNYKELIKLL